MEFKICIIPQKAYLSTVFDNKLFIKEIKNRYCFHITYPDKDVCLYTLSRYNKENCDDCGRPKYKIKLKNIFVCFNPTIRKFCYYTDDGNIYVIDSVLRLVSTFVLLFHNGILLHAAGVVKDNKKCILFVGETNSGKSTLAKNYPTRKVLSDEICPLILFGNKLYSWRSMFYSEVLPTYPKLGLIEVDKIIFLRKSHSMCCYDKLMRVCYREKIEQLLKNTLWFTKDYSLTNLLIDLIIKIVKINTVGYFEANMLKHFWISYDKI